jgi:dihydrofolate reductase
MGTLTVTEFMTLDGVAQAPGGADEDREGGFAHGGWQMPLVDRESAAVMFEQASAMDALLLGRRTYDIFAAYWPNAPDDIAFKGLLNRLPKYVASRTLSGPLAWRGAQVLDGELPDAVARLRRQHDEIHVIGSLDLVQSLLRHGLVDRLHLWLYPLLLGSGKPVFGAGTVPAQLRLAQSRTSPNGALQLTYELAGAPAYGGPDDVARTAGAGGA